MQHEALVQEAKDAIDKVFADTSVAQDKTRESLEELRDEIETKLDSLE